MLSPTIAAIAASAMTAAMSKFPRLARIAAVISAVSPGNGMPIDSPAMISAMTGSPTWATSTMVASTPPTIAARDRRLRDRRSRPRLARARRDAADGPRRGPHPRVRPARDEGDRQGPRAARGRRAGLRHGARQYLPPLPRARSRTHRGVRRPARVHALGRPDHHRLGGLSGLLDGARRGRRRDQGAPQRAAPQRHRLDRGGGRALPLLPRWLRALHGARDEHGGPGRARLR